MANNRSSQVYIYTMSTNIKKTDKYWLKEHAPIFLDGHEPLPEPVTDAILLPHTSLDSIAQIENYETEPVSSHPVIQVQNNVQAPDNTMLWIFLVVFIILIICGAIFLIALASQVQIN